MNYINAVITLIACHLIFTSTDILDSTITALVAIVAIALLNTAFDKN